MNKLLSDVQQVEISLRPGHEVPVASAGGDQVKRLLDTLHYQLTLLIKRVYQVTDTLPVVGDVLALESAVLRGWRETIGGQLPSQWIIEKRGFLNPGNQLMVAYKLRWVASAGIAETLDGDALVASELIELMPTTASKRSLGLWLSRPHRPIQTWIQLSLYAAELPSERGFNVKHLGIIEKLLAERGLEI